MSAAEITGRRITYRAATSRPPGSRSDRVELVVGGRVLGLGLADEEGTPLDLAPAGTVVEVEVVAGRGRLVVDWDVAPEGDVRAVVAVRRRELGLRSYDGALQLRRRDDDGRWQPMLDSVGELTIELEPPTAVVTARAALPSGATGIARRRVTVRGPA
jgi:hypothetical protein